MEPILRIRQDVRKACAQVAAVKDPDMALLFCYIAARGEGCALPEPQQLGLDENRLQKARSLLVSTSLSINEISQMFGYPSLQYFYSVFKKEYDVTPKEYRDRHSEVML